MISHYILSSPLFDDHCKTLQEDIVGKRLLPKGFTSVRTSSDWLEKYRSRLKPRSATMTESENPRKGNAETGLSWTFLTGVSDARLHHKSTEP